MRNKAPNWWTVVLSVVVALAPASAADTRVDAACHTESHLPAEVVESTSDSKVEEFESGRSQRQAPRDLLNSVDTDDASRRGAFARHSRPLARPYDQHIARVHGLRAPPA